MNEALGDLWTGAADAIVITTNGTVRRDGALVMGRGCALQAKRRFPGIEYKAGSMVEHYGNRALNLGLFLPRTRIWTMPVKHNWWETADIQLIAESARQLMEMADRFSADAIRMPRPGCGNGNLNWQDVEPVLADILDDRFTAITYPIGGTA